MHGLAAWMGVIVVMATMAAPARAASPQDARERAEALVAEGLDYARSAKKLQESGKTGYREAYKSAITKFEEANRLYPDPTIQHNLARAHEELGEFKVAFDWYTLALKQDYDFAKDGRERLAKIEAALRESHALVTVRTTPSDVTVRLQFNDGTNETHVSTPFQTWAPAGPLRIVASNPEFKTGNKEYALTAGEDRSINLVLEPLPRQGFFEVDANVAGAKVFLSEVLVATLPMQSVTYPAGIYKLKVTAKGYTTHKEQVVVTKDQLTAVTVALEPDGSSVGGDVTPGDGGPPTWIGATMVGLGAGAVILGVVFHVRAFGFNSDANKVPVSEPPIQADEDRYDELFGKAKNNEKYAWISYGAGAVLVGTGIALLVIGGDDEPADGERASTSSPSFVPTFQAGPGYVGGGGTVTF